MNNNSSIKRIVIPEHEIEISTSRSGGPGGQHVNKTNSRITARFNLQKSSILTDEQKERATRNLNQQLTSDGDLIVHCNESRSQQHNKKRAIEILTDKITKSLYIPKKRIKTHVPQSIQETRLKSKAYRSIIKKIRSKKIHED